MIAVPVHRLSGPRFVVIPGVEEPPFFTRFIEAARWWRAPGRAAALFRQSRPPIDALDDPVWDAALAVIFRHVVRAPDALTGVKLIQCAVEANTDTVAYYRRSPDPSAAPAADGIERMLAVLERWRGQLAEEGL